MDEVLEERDALLKERQELEVAKEEAEKALAAAKVDCKSHIAFVIACLISFPSSELCR